MAADSNGCIITPICSSTGREKGIFIFQRGQSSEKALSIFDELSTFCEQLYDRELRTPHNALFQMN
jgi:hypothetical protein